MIDPSSSPCQGYHGYVDEMLPHESPVHYGLHPNAEIEFLTVTSDGLFHTLLELQSPDAAAGEGASQSLEEKVANTHTHTHTHAHTHTHKHTHTHTHAHTHTYVKLVESTESRDSH